LNSAWNRRVSVLPIYPVHTLTWTDYVTRPKQLNWFSMWPLVNEVTNFGLRAGRECPNHINDNKLHKKLITRESHKLLIPLLLITDHLSHNILVMNKQVIRTFKRIHKWTHYRGWKALLAVPTLTSVFRSPV